jgi:tRNA(Ile)-lysidine synthase
MRTGVAVSGGADSVYLLHHLLSKGLRLLVLHVNHALRGPESDADERFVRDLAAQLGLEILVRRGPLAPGNIEQEARRIRHAWFRELVVTGVVNRVALGHTRSDQAETVLFRFLRGSGTAGLAGIRPETGVLWRPMLALTRARVRESLRARGIPWREDSSNADPRFVRNKIRHELLPQLTSNWNPNLEAALAQTADWAQAEERYWARKMLRWQARYFRETPVGLVVAWPKLGVAASRRLARHAIERAKGDLRGIEFHHVEAFRALKSGRLNLPGLDVERSFEWYRLAPAGADTAPPAAAIRLELRAAGDVYNKDKHQLDWDAVPGPLELRHWRDGDRYRRVGRSKDERLKLLFQKARVPVWERRSWPVLMCAGSIGWTRGFGAAAGLERTEFTKTVLLVEDSAGFPNLKPS